MRQKLYPASRHPAGHPDLSKSFNNLGVLLRARGEYERAQAYLEQALAMRQKLYPASKHRTGHPDLALSLNGLGVLLHARGEYGRAQPYLEQALAMYQQLYPASTYPNGHSHLATCLSNLGLLLDARGEYGRAQQYYEQALAMQQRLYPASTYPDGHPDLALSFNNLGFLLVEREEYGRAQPYCEQALAMRQKLYPVNKYPAGHPDLATSFNSLGLLLQAQGEYGRAQAYLEQALATRQRLYPASTYPYGHPHLALSLNNLGGLVQVRGEYGRAQAYLEQALAMRQRLYPASTYPAGHPDLARSLSNLGHLLQARGECGQAQPYCEQALAMQQSLADRLVESFAFAEAAQYIATLPLRRDALLSVTAHTRSADDALYSRLWTGRSALRRLLERRHQSLQAVADRPEIRSRWVELTDTGRQLTRLFLNPPEDTKNLDEQARTLTARKEQLERELAPLLPALAAQKELDALGPKDLQRSLPERVAFVDLLRYTYFEQDPEVPDLKGAKRTLRYVAFVLTRDQMQRVELGNAAGIEAALEQWRQAINARRDDAAADELRRLVWEPIVRRLPAHTDTVYFAPDGALTRLPWAALPGDQPGTVLLERFTFALVPHGRFLLARLRETPKPGTDPPGPAGLLLAVGGVRYDDTPVPIAQPPVGHLVAALSPDRSMTNQWRFLPATEREVKSLASFTGLPVRALSGSEASTAQLFWELPRARMAHLATHGFFAQDAFDEEQRRAARQLEHWQFQPAQATQPIGLGARNPLSYAGLVLAGANRPQQAGPNGGILTGEALIHLPLERLQLAVLSACQTGLGGVADGQCVHSLQLAFHVAGCPNVVASLWNVPDQPTAALMAVFYDELLRHQRSPLAALRQAQLTLYCYPQRITELAERGAMRQQKAQPVGPSGAARAAVKDWAAFVLSGRGS
jgi:CHAT domain-containing protein/uncharacterized protein HemY